MRVGLRAAVAAASFVLLIVSGLAWATYTNFTNDIPRGAPLPPLPAGAKDLDGKDQNILLIGNDSRAGATKAELRALSTAEDGGSVNTDTMMLLHVPADGSRATVVSFPRDSWVDIPGYGKGKINSAYGDGYTAAKNAHKSEQAAQSAGIVMTARAISGLTGLHVDHYVQVNLLGFYRISNAIGGIPVCLNAAQNPNTDSDAFGRGYSGINLPKGVSVIKGSQALAFVRQRHGLPNGDLDRIKRQQYFLASAFRKVESAGVLLNPFKLHDLLTAVGSSLLTDPSLDLLAVGREFAQMSAGNITFKTIPNDGPQLIYPDGVETAIVAVNNAAMPDFILQLRGKSATAALDTAKPAAPSSVTVDVFNGTDTVGLAGRNADRLKALGFKVTSPQSADSSAMTVIEYPTGMEGQAKALATAVRGAKLVQASVPRVTLILGRNGVEVNGVSTGTSGSTRDTTPARTTKAANPTTPRTSAPVSPTQGLGCIN